MLYVIYCILYILDSILYVICYILYIIYCISYIIYYILSIIYYISYTIYYILYTISKIQLLYCIHSIYIHIYIYAQTPHGGLPFPSTGRGEGGHPAHILSEHFFIVVFYSFTIAFGEICFGYHCVS